MVESLSFLSTTNILDLPLGKALFYLLYLNNTSICFLSRDCEGNERSSIRSWLASAREGREVNNSSRQKKNQGTVVFSPCERVREHQNLMTQNSTKMELRFHCVLS